MYAQSLAACPPGSPCRGLGLGDQVGLAGPRSGDRTSLGVPRARPRGTGVSGLGAVGPDWPVPPSPPHQPTGSLWPDRLHLAPRSTLWVIEYSAGRVPRLPPLKNYISYNVLGRYSRGLSGLVVLAHALSSQPPLPGNGGALSRRARNPLRGGGRGKGAEGEAELRLPEYTRANGQRRVPVAPSPAVGSHDERSLKPEVRRSARRTRRRSRTLPALAGSGRPRPSGSERRAHRGLSAHLNLRVC